MDISHYLERLSAHHPELCQRLDADASNLMTLIHVLKMSAVAQGWGYQHTYHHADKQYEVVFWVPPSQSAIREWNEVEAIAWFEAYEVAVAVSRVQSALEVGCGRS